METEIKTLADLKQASGKPAVIDFFAQWCGPCKMIAPFYAQLSKTYTNVAFFKADVDVAEELTAHFGIESMPTFIFLDANGNEKSRFSGAMKDKLEAAIKSL